MKKARGAQRNVRAKSLHIHDSNTASQGNAKDHARKGSEHSSTFEPRAPLTIAEENQLIRDAILCGFVYRRDMHVVTRMALERIHRTLNRLKAAGEIEVSTKGREAAWRLIPERKLQ